MIRNVRDVLISLLVLYVLIVAILYRMQPEKAGEWLARKDIAYDAIWGEYVMDCDCTMEYVE